LFTAFQFFFSSLIVMARVAYVIGIFLLLVEISSAIDIDKNTKE